MTIHQRDESGQLTAQPDPILPQPPEMDMGGHGSHSTIGEYMKFIRMIINDGNGPQGRVLKAETVEQMAKNGLGNLKSCAWNSSNPALANSGDFFPGLTKSWGLTFRVNDEQAPTGRPAGQLSWAGIANSFYWIDRKKWNRRHVEQPDLTFSRYCFLSRLRGFQLPFIVPLIQKKIIKELIG